MLNVAETTKTSTIVPVTKVSEPGQGQKHATKPVAPVAPYAIGPIDPVHLLSIQADLSEGGVCPLLLPHQVPLAILNDPAFRDGYEYNYLSEEEAGAEEELWMSSVPRLVNHICKKLTDERWDHDLETDEPDQDFLPWQVGWLLRDLTRLAQRDRTLALVGINHLCFLLPLLPPTRPVVWPHYNPRVGPRYLHDLVLSAYRAQVRSYREQGQSFEQAQRSALQTNGEGVSC